LEHMHHGTYVPLIAYVVSCLGCALGLVCANKARTGTHASRNQWLALSAVSIGGTGIWAMHFTGMLGVSVDDSVVRWEVLPTVLSLVIAIVVVGVGMFLVGYGAPRAWTLPVAGVITGSGVATMHYMGMAAMRIQGTIHYDIALVALSELIAVVAATAALWITRAVRRGLAMVASVPIMGLAVCGMHYTGMSATMVTVNADLPVPPGAQASMLVWPLIIWIIVCPVLTLSIIALAPSGEEVLQNRYYQDVAAELRRQ
jgi:NO-binding membrane sensor protein with MHYT domain